MFTKKALLHIHLHVFYLHFLRMHYDYLFCMRLWKCASAISFRKYKRKVVLLSIYLFNYNSSNSTFFIWIWHLTLSWIQYLSNKLEFFVFCNTKITRTFFFLPCMFWYVFFYKNLIVLYHGDNTFLFYFGICIKFTHSIIISTMKKW